MPQAASGVRRFWTSEVERDSFGYRADGSAAIHNKVGAFLADPVMRRIVTEPREPISLRRIMDDGQVRSSTSGRAGSARTARRSSAGSW